MKRAPWSGSLAAVTVPYMGGRSTFLKCAEETNAGLLCISALLNTTMPSMELTINAAKEAELRNKVKILVGGADGYAPECCACGRNS